MIEVKGISKSYGNVNALRSVSLEIKKGEACKRTGYFITISGALRIIFIFAFFY